MKALLALTNHNIDFCQQSLARMKDCPPVAILKIDDLIKQPTSKQHILLVPTVATLLRNATVLNQCPEILVIVFDAPVLCGEVNAQMLDVEKQTFDFLFTFKHLESADMLRMVRKALASAEQVQIKKQTVDMSTKLLKRAYGSIIGKLLTFIYKVPDTDRRQEIQQTIFAAWWNGKPQDALEFLRKRYSKNAAAQEFIKHLQGEDARRFAAAIADVRTLKDNQKPVNLPKISKAHKVSVYDLRYYSKVRK